MATFMFYFAFTPHNHNHVMACFRPSRVEWIENGIFRNFEELLDKNFYFLGTWIVFFYYLPTLMPIISLQATTIQTRNITKF
jgi:hypothetical protein